jgi:hypothetical protein
MDNLNQIISDLQSENNRLETELKKVREAISALSGLKGNAAGRKTNITMLKPRRRLSAAARKRIAQAQKERWAKWKAKRAA